MFNEQMLSSCRTDGLWDVATASSGKISLGASLRCAAPRQGCAAQMLRGLLALDPDNTVEAEASAERDGNDLHRHLGEEVGCRGEGKAVERSPVARCQIDT